MSFSKLLIHVYNCLLNTSNLMTQKYLNIDRPKTERIFHFSLNLNCPPPTSPLNAHLFKCRSHLILLCPTVPSHEGGLYLPSTYISNPLISNSVSMTVLSYEYRLPLKWSTCINSCFFPIYSSPSSVSLYLN